MKHNLITFILISYFLNLNAQENRTTFGLQYKPIIPSKYFNSSYINKNYEDYNFNLNPKYSNSFGMIIRQKINKTFSIESGLNYTQRNYKLEIANTSIHIDDFTFFPIRSYEIPIQFLTYVRVSNIWYLNVSFGISHNVIASDVFSEGDQTTNYFQNTYRKNGGYRALLANIGIEYRTQEKGHYYIGTSLHRAWGEIGRIYPEYKDEDTSFNYLDNFNDKIFLAILGNFITIDFRYFFLN